MKEFVEYIVKHLVDQPDSVSIEEIQQEDRFVVTIRVAQSDIGKIIGKQGRTVIALRTLTAAVGKKTGRKADIEILES
jgi:predicted RNA-binding protein YlqC (UPF0109 family)